MKNQITILNINYFGELEGENFNAKVVYSKGQKSFHACIYLDYLWKEVYFPKQPKECKVLTGLEQAIRIQQRF